MTGKTFMNAVANGETDILQTVLNVLEEAGSDYCVIGGLAVNAYAEPVVSLDLDVVVASRSIDNVCEAARGKGLKVERFEHSVNLTSPKSDLRVQFHTNARYQAFISRSAEREVLGYKMKVAAIEDVLQGKVWAYLDTQRRKSKRQKDLADIMRLVEACPQLENLLPGGVRDTMR